MNNSFRRVVLALTALVALFVGVWAAAFPAAFYSSFPGLGLHWISEDGAFNEHLIRDVGGLYLALATTTIAAMFSTSATPARMIGLGWTVFNTLHLAYHVTHLDGSTVDRIGNVVSLSIVLVLGVLLLLPARAQSVSSEINQERNK